MTGREHYKVQDWTVQDVTVADKAV